MQAEKGKGGKAKPAKAEEGKPAAGKSLEARQRHANDSWREQARNAQGHFLTKAERAAAKADKPSGMIDTSPMRYRSCCNSFG